MQNISHAVMSQRIEPADSLDDFPTPPWATRALCQWMMGWWNLSELAAWEPACGRGDMAKALDEYFDEVFASDVHDYRWDEVQDFLAEEYSLPSAVDWIITNPPFRLAADFYRMARDYDVGVALLCRTQFLEGGDRYRRIFEQDPPIVLQFVERVPMVKGRLDAKVSTATAYAWFIWPPEKLDAAGLDWIPPCRKRLEREGDYPE